MKDARVSLMAAVIAGFGAVISEVGAVMMVGGNISTSDSNVTRVMTTAIVEETTKGRYSTALALGLVLLGIVFLVNILPHAPAAGIGRAVAQLVNAGATIALEAEGTLQELRRS